LAPNFLRDLLTWIKIGQGRFVQGMSAFCGARFCRCPVFWETDQKCRLADYLPKLAAVTFQAKLGSYGDKVERMRTLARWIAEQWFASSIPQASVASADRAAELAKCDLVTDMVP